MAPEHYFPSSSFPRECLSVIYCHTHCKYQNPLQKQLTFQIKLESYYCHKLTVPFQSQNETIRY